MNHRSESTLPALMREGDRIALIGSWTLERAAEIRAAIERLPRPSAGSPRLSLERLERMDSAGAILLAELASRLGLDPRQPPLEGGDPALMHWLQHMLAACKPIAEAPRLPGRDPATWLLEHIGRAMLAIGRHARELLGFFGLTVITLLRVLAQPRRLRLTPIAHHIEQVGIDAVPLVGLLSFLVGAVIAFLGATVLKEFAAEVYTVELVSFSFLREFGVLLAAILLAGRTASAFTAQIGAMKSHEEIDAMRVLGLDPVELLVIPRLLALVLVLPMLAFLAAIAGIVGGAIVAVMSLEMSPALFVVRFWDTLELRHVWVGLIKAPVFALIIAVIGCLQGFKVTGSAESVGERTTSSVVQAIFLVILFDALFAVFFMEIGM